MTELQCINICLMLRKEYISQIWEFFGWNANTTLKAFTEQKFWKTSLNDNENVNIVKHFSSYVLHIVFWVMISFLKFCSHIHAYMEYIHVGHHRISLKKTHSLQYTIKDCILFWFFEGGGVWTSSSEDWPCLWNEGGWTYHCSHRSGS